MFEEMFRLLVCHFATLNHEYSSIDQDFVTFSFYDDTILFRDYIETDLCLWFLSDVYIFGSVCLPSASVVT